MKCLMKITHYFVASVVELSRTSYQEPELPLSQKKSEVILAKKAVLIGEVVNGGPLPNPPQHIPVCSFDSQNKYRGEGPLAEPTSNQLKGTGFILHIITLTNTCCVTGLAPFQNTAFSEHHINVEILINSLIFFIVSAIAARMEAKASTSAELQPQMVSLLDTPAVFRLPQAVAEEPIPQHQPIKAASPPAKPEPVYSDEVGNVSLLLLSDHIIYPTFRTNSFSILTQLSAL